MWRRAVPVRAQQSLINSLTKIYKVLTYINMLQSVLHHFSHKIKGIAFASLLLGSGTYDVLIRNNPVPGLGEGACASESLNPSVV